MPVVHRLLDEAAPPRPAPLLWRDEMPEEILRSHDDGIRSPPIDLIEARGVRLGGRGLLAEGGRIRHEPRFAPRHVRHVLKVQERTGDVEGIRRWVGALLSPDAEMVAVDRPVLAPVSANWVYGHFLLDMLPRAMILDRVCPPDWPVAVSTSGSDWLPRFLAELAPGRPLVTYRGADQALTAPLFLSCNDPCTTTHCRPELRTFANLLKARLLARPILGGLAGAPPDGSAQEAAGERIFVSRTSARSPIHSIENEAEVEAALAARGYLVVKPEALAFEEQIRVFDRARLVVGEYGSGIHNTVFSQPGTTVVCLNWLNGYQSRIASLFEHRLGFVAPEGGRFLSAQEIVRTGLTLMRFDLPALLSRLDRLERRLRRQGRQAA